MPPRLTSFTPQTDYHVVPTGVRNSPTSLLRRARRSIIVTVVFPAIFAFLLTAGLGTTLIIWLLSHRVNFQRIGGAFLVDEGTKEDAPNEANLTGLTITSLTSTLVSLVNPLVMVLLAYLISSRWLRMQDKPSVTPQALPTPLQYGLMVGLLGVGDIFSLFDSLCYKLQRSRRAETSFLFTLSLIGALLSYALTNAVGAVDFWLHLVTSATVLNTTTPFDSTLPYSFAMNNTLCAPWTAESTHACLVYNDGWAIEQPWVLSHGLELASNASQSSKIITLADSKNAAIIVPRNPDATVDFRAKTYGARAECRSLNPICLRENDLTKNCSNVGIPELPFDTSNLFILNEHKSSIILARVEDVVVGDFYGVYRASGKVPSNPFPTYLQFQWNSFISGEFQAPSPAVDTKAIPNITMYADCKTSFFEAVIRRPVTPGVDGEQYILENETPTDANMTAILMAPLLYQYTTDKMLSNLHSTIIGENDLKKVESSLSQELSRMAIGIIGGALETSATISQSRIGTKVVGKYPVAPVYTFVFVLYVYALLVMVVVALAFFRFGRRNDHFTHQVTQAQMQLTDSLAIIASRFPSSQLDKDDPIDMFGEHEPCWEPERLYLSKNGVYSTPKHETQSQ